MNDLPATVISLSSLDAHPARVWALVLGVNLGPMLWVTGALDAGVAVDAALAVRVLTA